MGRTSRSTRERLFAAAAELIGEHGFHGTTVDDIVERAGVAKGTVYYHFHSKDQLLDELLVDHLTRMGESFRAAADSAETATAGLRLLVRTELDYIHRYQAASKLLMSELWRADRTWRDSLTMLRDRYVLVIREVLDAGVASGEFRADLDTPLAASAIFGTVATAALDWLVFDPDRDVESVASGVEGLVLHGTLT